MHAALLMMALFGNEPVIPISDRVPKLNVEATCKAAAADDKAMELSMPQSYDKCMGDETAAQQQLTVIWQSHPASLRDRCEVEIRNDSQSYVEFLICLQAADIGNPPSRAQAAGQNRNAK